MWNIKNDEEKEKTYKHYYILSYQKKLMCVYIIYAILLFKHAPCNV